MRLEHKLQMRIARLAATLFVAVAEAHAQTTQKQAPAGQPETRRIVVSLPDHKLVLMDGERVVKTYQVAAGKASTPSPAGKFQVASMVANPAYRAHGQDVAPGPKNPVGTRWIGLNAKGYGIHGTNAPGSIGKDASHGCIRMRNKDVEELFALVKVGVPVELISGSLPAEKSTVVSD
jgi:lipoprotein-anchoring transpeptidase ErfK/SrfK